MQCNVCIYLAPYEYYILHRGPVVVVSYRPAPLLRQLGLDTERIIVPLSSKGLEPHGVPSPCGHSCMVCATVCLIVVPSFSDKSDVSTIRHSPATFVRPGVVRAPGGVRSPQRRSFAPASFVRPGGVRPPRRRSSAPAAFVLPGGVRPPQRRSSVPAALVRFVRLEILLG